MPSASYFSSEIDEGANTGVLTYLQYCCDFACFDIRAHLVQWLPRFVLPWQQHWGLHVMFISRHQQELAALCSPSCEERGEGRVTDCPYPLCHATQGLKK
jgi:hypothetical protein